MNTKISAHAKDVIQKYTSGLFKDATLEFYGIKTAKIKELINVELPVIEVGELSTDFIFLLDDDTYLHFEFQTTYNKSDLMRFAMYDIRLFERDRRCINTVVIYSADVRNADASLNIGSLVFEPSKVMMYDYDGNQIFKELEAKINSGCDLSDVDMLNLIFLPLMRNAAPREILAVNSIKLAQTITDKVKRNTCIATVFAFANKYLSDVEAGKLLEVLKMTDLATMLIEDVVNDERMEIARNALRKGLNINDVSDITGLTADAVRQIKEGMKE